MVAPPYRRVPQNEDNAARSSSNTAQQSRSERISIKLHALLWVIVAYALASYTQLFHTLFTDERILRPSLYISLFAYTLNIILIIYLTIYLPYKFPTSDKYITSASSPQFWNAYCPSVIPIITASFVLGSTFLCRACFPIWGFFTPLLLGVVGLGIFFSLHFIPICGGGSVQE
jgi:hypothetical protein